MNPIGPAAYVLVTSIKLAVNHYLVWEKALKHTLINVCPNGHYIMTYTHPYILLTTLLKMKDELFIPVPTESTESF